MKKILLSIISFFVVFQLIAQAPEKFNYQAIIRNSSGEAVKDQQISLKFEIIKISNEITVYTETHSLTTNSFGLINTQIGTGESSNSFSDIDWAQDDYKVQVSFDSEGTGSYTTMGSEQLLSVPYALYAATSGDKQTISINGNIISLSDGGSITLPEDQINDADADATNEIQTLTIKDDTIFLSSGGFVELPDNFSGDYNDLTNKPTLSGDVTGDLGEATVEKIQGMNISAISPADGQVLKWNNTTLTWEPSEDQLGAAGTTDGVVTSIVVTGESSKTITLNRSNSLASLTTTFTDEVNDADADASNEIQDLSLSGTTLSLSGDATTVDLSILQDGTGTDDQTLSLSGNTLSIENGNSVNLSSYLDNTDAQDLSISGTTLSLTGDATSVDLSSLQDGTGTDDQTLSLSGNTLSIEDGNSVDLSGYLDNTDAQDLSLSGTTLSLTGDATSVDLSSLQDGYEANTDDQTLSLSSNTLSIENGNSVNLSSYLDNTDAQDLSISGTTLSLTGDATSVDLSILQDGTGTDDQTLSLSGNTLSIEDGNSVDLSGYLDNTDAQDLSLSGTTLSLTGDATSVDLSALQDGTGTDDQTLAEVLTESNDAGAVKITNLADPVDDQDAATKAYVDMLKSQIETLENNLIEAGSYKVYDIDGNSYNVVKIGDQVWMAENLRVTTYPDGTPIPTVSDDNTSGSTDDEWAALADDNISDAYCYYNDNASGEGDTYGVLYTYAAAIGDNWAHDIKTNQGVCPDGWHLPSNSEFSELNNALSYPLSGADLKEDGLVHWASPNTGATNSSEFTALPGGSRTYYDGTYVDLTYQGSFWTLDYWNSTDAVYYFLEYDSAEFKRGTTIYNPNKSNGYSVRCIKD